MKYQKYIDSVVSHPEKYCLYVRQAVDRHLRDLEREDLFFDTKEADRHIQFIEALKHVKGAWANTKFVLEDWQAFVHASLFGWRIKYRDRWIRRFKYCYIEVPRKNGKSAWMGGIGLDMLTIDGEEGSEVFCVATTKDQTKAVFEQAQGMARKLKKDSRIMDGLVNVYQHNIHVLETSSKFEKLASDEDTLDGLNPHCTIIDEYHAHKDDGVYNVMKSGMGARSQPLQIAITTAGFNKALPCYKLRETIIDILSGNKTDDTQFGIVYTLDKDDDWNDPATWGKANPNLNVSVDLKFLQDEYNQAIINGSSQEVNFKTKNLNIWTDASAVWITDEVWGKNTYGLTEEDLFGRYCYGGLDLASGIDFNAFVALFPNVRPNVHAVKVWLWKPANKMYRNKEKVDYRNWERAGHIISTPGDVIEWGFITEKIKEIAGTYELRSIAYDPYRANHGVLQELSAYGILCHDLAQIMSRLAEPTRQLETMATAYQFEHFNNPVLKWMMGQAEIIRDSKGNIMVTKKDQMKKIDGVSALVNAIAEWKTFENQNPNDFIMSIELDQK